MRSAAFDITQKSFVSRWCGTIIRFFWLLPARILISLLVGYRWAISPLYGPVCRYFPSCSAYALEAVTVHGSIKGSYLALKRLLRCHPWAAGGIDPVPARTRSGSFEDVSRGKTAKIIMLNHPERYVESCECAEPQLSTTHGPRRGAA